MLNLKRAAPYQDAALPFHHLLPEPVPRTNRSQLTLVLVLTVLVATKALMLRDFLGADFHKSQGCCLLTSIICLPTLPIPCLGPWNARVQWQTVAALSLMWLSYVDRNMAPSVTSKPSSIPDTSLQNKVTFQDEWYLGALFWEMKLEG